MKGDEQTDVFGLGLFSEDGKDLLRRMEKARELGLPTDDGEGIRETLAALLEWFEEKGRDGLPPRGAPILEGVPFHDAAKGLRYDPDERIEDPTHRQLEHAARYLRFLVFEKAAEDEMDHIYFFDEGLDADMSESVADSIRHQQETVALVALELGMLAAEAGLKPHLPDLLRGEIIVQAARRGHEAIHGTQEAKHARWDKWQKKVDEIRERNPSWSKREVARHTGEKLGVTERTIRKRTEDNGPK